MVLIKYFSFLDSIFENTDFVSNAEDLWEDIQTLFDEIKLKDKGYKNRLMNEDKPVLNKKHLV